MERLQSIVNNREIALSVWIIIAVVVGLCTKAGREFLGSIALIIFNRKFIIFCMVFLSFFVLTVLYLYWVGFWNIFLLKDTIFWVMFVEIPLFTKTIEKAKDARFFAKLIKDNLALIVIIEFLLNFWTFNLVIELAIVPITFVLGAIYAFALRDKNTAIVKKFLDGLFAIFGIVVTIYSTYHLIISPKDLWNIEVLKEFVFPIILLFMNLPVVYGLALYNVYEQVFIRVKGKNGEQQKMKRQIFRFAGVDLAKITSVRNNTMRTTMVSLTNRELQQNLERLKLYLNTRIGDNYMKRSHFYIICCVGISTACLIGIIMCNSTVAIKDLLSFNFTLNMDRIKQIVTYILSSGLAVSVCFLFYFIGFGKKKYEDISQIKKFALHDLLFFIRQQGDQKQEFPPIDDPEKLFTDYLLTAYKINRECNRAIATYENLLSNWELDTVKRLQMHTNSFLFNISIDDISCYTKKEFTDYFMEKKRTSIQSEKINIYVSDVESSLKKYSESIEQCMELFKDCI